MSMSSGKQRLARTATILLTCGYAVVVCVLSDLVNRLHLSNPYDSFLPVKATAQYASRYKGEVPSAVSIPRPVWRTVPICTYEVHGYQYRSEPLDALRYDGYQEPQLTVFYNPQEPSEIVLRREYVPRLWNKVASVIVLVMGFIGAIPLYGRGMTTIKRWIAKITSLSKR